MKLPEPFNPTELYLAAVVKQLEQVNVNLASLIELSTQEDMPELDGGVIEIREPAESVQTPKKRGRPKKKA